jgi:hypothetical protein
VRKTKNQRGQNEIDQNRSRAEQASQVQRLVTRAQIAQTLWGPDAFVDVEQGINTAVRKIRRALGDDADEPQYLQTVVGRGYRFVAPDAREFAASQPEAFTVSAEELGRAIMTAAGLDPENPGGTPKRPAEK